MLLVLSVNVESQLHDYNYNAFLGANTTCPRDDEKQLTHCSISLGTSMVSAFSVQRSAFSVHYLQTDLLQEFLDSSLDEDTATVYNMEDLRQSNHGIIRSKGANNKCPR